MQFYLHIAALNVTLKELPLNTHKTETGIKLKYRNYKNDKIPR